MAKRHIHIPGEIVHGFTIKGPAPNVAGHVRWHVVCNACELEGTYRGTALRSGAAACSCNVETRPKAPKSSDVSRLTDDLADANSRIDTLLEMIESMPTADQFIDLMGRVEAQAERIEVLERDSHVHTVNYVVAPETSAPAEKPEPEPEPEPKPADLAAELTPRKLGYKAKDEGERRAARARNVAAMADLLERRTGKAEFLLRYEAEFDDILFDADKASREARKQALADLNDSFLPIVKEMT